jgi:hypothetical protein
VRYRLSRVRAQAQQQLDDFFDFKPACPNCGHIGLETVEVFHQVNAKVALLELWQTGGRHLVRIQNKASAIKTIHKGRPRQLYPDDMVDWVV